MKFVYKTEEMDCWIWTGGRHKYGYGNFYLNHATIRAHVFSYEYFISQVPDGLYVCHTCDIPSCVNPDHLWVGTPKENTRDVSTKKRWPDRRGEGAANHKHTSEEIIEIRRMYAEDGLTLKQIGSIYGIDKSLIHLIVSRKTWKNV